MSISTVLAEKQNIEPRRITKPIQLLAAWLAGLILVNASFLSEALAITDPPWARSFLIVACVCNVPLFLLCIFLLQTRYRPEMQEDSYYSKYLEANTGKVLASNANADSMRELQGQIVASNQKQLALISKVESTVMLLSKRLAETTENTLSETRKLEIEESVSRSFEAIEFARKQTTSEQTQILVNDLIPHYKLIVTEIEKEDLVITETFGSTSVQPVKPLVLIVSFGALASIDSIRAVVYIAMKYGFTHICYSPADTDVRRIYIGSYIYRHPQEAHSVAITDAILQLLNRPEVTTDHLIEEINSCRLARHCGSAT